MTRKEYQKTAYDAALRNLDQFTTEDEDDQPEERIKKYEIKKMEDLRKFVSTGELIETKTSLFKGYVSRKANLEPKPYEGKYGKGYILEHPNYNSTRYSYRTYYIFKEYLEAKN